MTTITLPPLSSIQSSTADKDSPLAQLLSLLFEPSPILFSILVPEIASSLLPDSPISSYSQLIHNVIDVVTKWDDALKAQFIASHPRIGENKNLSKLSAKEQGTVSQPELQARLEHLNSCYERRYPGLRYITFVNGRTRATIAKEIEDALGITHSLSADEPAIASLKPLDIGSGDWKLELSRAVDDVGRIAQGRLKVMMVE